ncbi:MAG: tRNA pseudouridine(55) synthase TruB [Elusimicrobiaceae bacterium]|nr:tRNA pseudouridine(55) synthase TruB [Elusimicrobiaceae bacterium]
MIPSKTFTDPAKSGILLINKPKDFSSHDIIAICRREMKTKKIGHSGTLDPMATGLLILLIGRDATRQQDQFLKLDKVYSATLTLGEETDSWDAYGEVIRTAPVPTLTQVKLEEAAKSITGKIRQPIPFFSAKRINGNRMYELARKGAEMERKYNEVTVEWLQIQLQTPTQISFTVRCSCGTYVRSLGYMLAEKLGTVGHLTTLTREQIGTFDLKDAFDGNLLKNCGPDILYNRLLPVTK